jgi:hypothetical protein
MELAIFKNPIPIKAIPEKDLNAVLFGSFLDWISAILSLNEDATSKLEYALPAIKEHCWSMGFPEIKKMIEMYADGKLSVKPIPNHFDRIKFGEVAAAYNEFNRSKVEKIDVDQEKKQQDILDIITLFDYFKQYNRIPHNQVWVYTYLEERLEDFKFTKEEKQILMQLGKEQKLTQEDCIIKSKRVLLSRYFTKLIARDKHIKDLI